MRYCTSCHLKEELTKRGIKFFPMHPRNVFISDIGQKFKQNRGNFPLFDDFGHKKSSGIITCPTCHDPHVWDSADPSLKPAHGEKGNAVNSFLRNKGATFGYCSDCHSMTAFLLYKNFHNPREWEKKGNR